MRKLLFGIFAAVLLVVATNLNTLLAGSWSAPFGEEIVYAVDDTLAWPDDDSIAIEEELLEDFLQDSIAIVPYDEVKHVVRGVAVPDMYEDDTMVVVVDDTDDEPEADAPTFVYEVEGSGRYLFSVNPDGVSVTLQKGLARKTEVLSIPSVVCGLGGAYYVTAIADFAMRGYGVDDPDEIEPMEGVKNLYLPDGLQYVGQNCFEYAHDLETVVLPASLCNLGYCMFAGCENLKSVYVPEHSRLTTIGNFALMDCMALKSFYIPASVTHIGQAPWRNCKALEALSISEDNFDFYVYEGVLYNGDVTHLMQYPAGKKNKEYAVLFGTQAIDNSAFYGNDYIEKVTFPASLEEISHIAFYDCTNLREVVFTGQISFIGNKAFRGCKNLRSIQLYGTPTYTWEGNDYSAGSYNSFDSGTIINVDEGSPQTELVADDGTLFERVMLTVSALPRFTTIDLVKNEDYGFPKYLGKGRVAVYGNAAPKEDVLKILDHIGAYKLGEDVDERGRIRRCYVDYDKNQVLYFFGGVGGNDLIVALFKGADTTRMGEFLRSHIYE